MEKQITFKRTSPTSVGVYVDGSASQYEIEKRYFWGDSYYSIVSNGREIDFDLKLKEAKAKVINLIKE